MRNTNFTDKESYLAYRSNWKADYNELTQKIRDLKWLRATRNQAHNDTYWRIYKHRGCYYYYSKLWEGVKNYLQGIPRYGELIRKYFGDDKPYIIEWELYPSRKLAAEMLEELKQSKIRSNQMRLKSVIDLK